VVTNRWRAVRERMGEGDFSLHFKHVRH
jgi:hypothetical protein